MTKSDPFKYFHSSPEIIRLAVMMYVRFPLSLRNVEDLLHERGIDISHETALSEQIALSCAGRFRSVVP
jgi:putative transposase